MQVQTLNLHLACTNYIKSVDGANPPSQVTWVRWVGRIYYFPNVTTTSREFFLILSLKLGSIPSYH